MLRFSFTFLALAGLLSLFSTSACSSGDERSSSRADGTEPGTVGPAADGQCNNLPASVVVELDTRAEAAPMAAGGALKDGTYVLTAGTLYVGVGGDVSAPHSTVSSVVVIQGDVANFQTEGTTLTGTLSTQGSSLTVLRSCPAPVTDAVEYTATESALVVFITKENGITVETFTRQ